MLKRLLLFLSMCIILLGMTCFGSSSYADSCTSNSLYTSFGGSTATVSVSCTTTTDSSRSIDGSESDSSDSTGCSKTDGAEVACWNSGYWWSYTFNRYCKVASLSPDAPQWSQHLDSAGNPVGTLYQCLLFQDENIYNLLNYMYMWADDTPVTPEVPGTDPETLVREAVVSLGLHAPEVGVGAYVYPKYEDWGLSWWVGAPMWMWTNDTDDLQWGTHTLTDSDGNLSVDATVTSTSISFDPGNGDSPVVCDSAGTLRPWDPNDLLSHHSPSGCEYTYLHTNTLGDKDSRFTVSATVTWTVTWSSSDGQYGTFTTTADSTDNPAIHVGELRTVLVTPK